MCVRGVVWAILGDGNRDQMKVHAGHSRKAVRALFGLVCSSCPGLCWSLGLVCGGVASFPAVPVDVGRSQLHGFYWLLLISSKFQSCPRSVVIPHVLSLVPSMGSVSCQKS